MERYSDVAADILNDLHTERLAYNSEYVPLMDAINRLGEYEDTGMEPIEIKASMCFLSTYRGADHNGRMEFLLDKSGYCSALGLTASRLRELAKADKEGITPCTFCRFNPPSSCDGKPCSMCPAEAALKEDRQNEKSNAIDDH